MSRGWICCEQCGRRIALVDRTPRLAGQTRLPLPVNVFELAPGARFEEAEDPFYSTLVCPRGHVIPAWAAAF